MKRKLLSAQGDGTMRGMLDWVTHPLMATYRKSFACYGLAIANTFHKAVPNNSMLMLTYSQKG